MGNLSRRAWHPSQSQTLRWASGRTISFGDRDPLGPIGIRPPQPAHPAKFWESCRVFHEMDDEGAVSRRDHVAFAQSHVRDAQAIDLGSIGASQVDQVAKRRPVFDLEMLAREDQVLRHRELRVSRTPNRQRVRMVNLIFLARMGPPELP